MALFHFEEWVDFNEADAVMKRSTSLKLAVNRHQRNRLELADFWAIHDHDTCPPWLRIAMEQSLITLPGPARNLCHAHQRLP